MQSIKDSLARGAKEICPHITTADKSTCLNEYLKNYTVTDTSQISLLAVIVVWAGTLDKKQGIPTDKVAFWMTENLVTLLEGIDINKFYLANTPKNEETNRLRLDDEKLARETKDKLIAQIEKFTKEISTTPSYKLKATEFRQRIETIKATSWKYSKSVNANGFESI